MFHKKIRLRLNNAHFLDNLSWKSTLIKFTICQQIKLSISLFCCLEMFSEFKTISTAFLSLTSTKRQLYRSILRAIGRVLLVTAVKLVPVKAFMKVERDRLSILKNGSLTGNLCEPHNTVCSKM